MQRDGLGQVPNDGRPKQEAQVANGGDGSQRRARVHPGGVAGNAIAHGDSGRDAEAYEKESDGGGQYVWQEDSQQQAEADEQSAESDNPLCAEAGHEVVCHEAAYRHGAHAGDVAQLHQLVRCPYHLLEVQAAPVVHAAFAHHGAEGHAAQQKHVAVQSLAQGDTFLFYSLS